MTPDTKRLREGLTKAMRRLDAARDREETNDAAWSLAQFAYQDLPALLDEIDRLRRVAKEAQFHECSNGCAICRALRDLDEGGEHGE